jgi:thymidylate synthase (FAD)
MSTLPLGAIPVLDKGYVRLVGITHDVEYTESGEIVLTPTTEVRAVADARVSTAKTARTFGPSEQRTLDFLLREDHTSPFRGQVVTIEVKAPLFVARQWWKYCIGHEHDESASRDPFLGWNEESRRYVESEPEFYIPQVWRTAPERRSQGSGGKHEDSDDYREELGVSVEANVERYHWALKTGVCAEQARLFLPAYALYTSWRWTSSLQGICHFLSQRLAHDAQSEIREYAEAIKQITVPVWPRTIEAMGTPKDGGEV